MKPILTMHTLDHTVLILTFARAKFSLEIVIIHIRIVYIVFLNKFTRGFKLRVSTITSKTPFKIQGNNVMILMTFISTSNADSCLFYNSFYIDFIFIIVIIVLDLITVNTRVQLLSYTSFFISAKL